MPHKYLRGGVRGTRGEEPMINTIKGLHNDESLIVSSIVQTCPGLFSQCSRSEIQPIKDTPYPPHPHHDKSNIYQFHELADFAFSIAFFAASAARSVSLYSSFASTALSILVSRTSPTAPNACFPPSSKSISSANC